MHNPIGRLELTMAFVTPVFEHWMECAQHIIYGYMVKSHYMGSWLTVVKVFAHGAMGRRIDPSWSGPIELFLIPASAPRLV